MGWINEAELSEEERRKIRRQMRNRAILRWFGHLAGRLLTRIEVTGKENIPTEGPVIFAANHLSTYDAVLMLVHLPPQTQILGPGDFKLLWPANIIVENIGIIMVKRGAVDRHSMREMEKVLKNGGFLGLFPEGGTWEKGLEDVKSGAAYLSATTGATIVPIALGNTYQVWSKMFRLKRPKVTMHFCEPMPPVQLSGDRKTRQQELQDASVELMKRIFEHLPPSDQKFYLEMPRRRYRGILTFEPSIALDTTSDFSGIAELVSKPNLFSPLHRNAKLPLKPFTSHLGRFVTAEELDVAARSLLTAFENDFKGFLEYRLGEEKEQRILGDLKELVSVAQHAAKESAKVKFDVQMWLAEG
ncbi:MAG: hypothetical protein CUN55_09885 [Phototrophicales bacterium]|nr:MAG: hypothetical protein CUN55_09885 [Phototrophicales bacterium]